MASPRGILDVFFLEGTDAPLSLPDSLLRFGTLYVRLARLSERRLNRVDFPAFWGPRSATVSGGKFSLSSSFSSFLSLSW